MDRYSFLNALAKTLPFFDINKYLSRINITAILQVSACDLLDNGSYTNSEKYTTLISDLNETQALLDPELLIYQHVEFIKDKDVPVHLIGGDCLLISGEIFEILSERIKLYFFKIDQHKSMYYTKVADLNNLLDMGVQVNDSYDLDKNLPKKISKIHEQQELFIFEKILLFLYKPENLLLTLPLAIAIFFINRNNLINITSAFLILIIHGILGIVASVEPNRKKALRLSYKKTIQSRSFKEELIKEIIEGLDNNGKLYCYNLILYVYQLGLLKQSVDNLEPFSQLLLAQEAVCAE